MSDTHDTTMPKQSPNGCDGRDSASPSESETRLTMSPELGELFAAMAKAQAEITEAAKDSKNPFFKSSYADLASVRAACAPALAKNGLCIVQWPSASGPNVSLATILGHSSGQWIRGDLTVKAKSDDAQSIGSAITYCRRYCLAAVAGVAAAEDDDDGNAASGRHQEPPKPRHEPAPKPNPEPAGNTKEYDDLRAAVLACGISETDPEMPAKAAKVILWARPGATIAQCRADRDFARSVLDELHAKRAAGNMTGEDILREALGVPDDVRVTT